MLNTHTSFRFARVALSPLTASLALATALACTPALSQTKNEALLEGAGVKVLRSDVQAELDRMPADVRTRVLGQPDMLRQLISNLYLRRALAAEAVQKGMDKRADVVALLKTQQEAILAEARVVDIAKSALQADDPATDKLAQTIYKAEVQRFEQPAQTRARHILVRGSDAEARAKAEKILADLKAGANFEELAKKESADPGSAAKGGDLGFFAKGRMVKAFDEAIDTLQQPGQLSGIVQSDFGLHIIRLEERKPAGVKPFEEVRDQLRAEASGKAQQNVRMKEIDRLQGLAKGNDTALQAFIAEQSKAAGNKPAQ
ncbi:MAG: peptidylprolyl isomerase [Burkholderiaceae bacterium]|nr:peptidylprolyl isomerase [Burkholderiaceae bacterium]